MNPEEYSRLEKIDAGHWFYLGKRAIVRHWIERSLKLGADDLLVDAGMGTGIWLEEMSACCRVLGLDDHEESVALAKPRLEKVGGRLMKTSLVHVDLPDACAVAVTLMDVLEHLDDDAGALREMIRLTRPGGLLVITVPALPWLWSDWDVALHHRRRYARGDLLRLVNQPGVQLMRCAYFNSALLLPIALVRWWRRRRPRPDGFPRSEDKIPGPLLNSLLYRIMVTPARWGFWRPWWGVSLLAVLRRTQP